MRTSTRWSAGLAAVASLALIAAACSSGSETSSPGSDTVSASGAPDLSGQTVEVAATWTSAEQRNFEKVLDLFEQQTGATTQFVSTGDDIAAYLGPQDRGRQAAGRRDPAAAGRVGQLRT
jgi:ABC-type glycerol-3-phosphate transport system substrate-binding protein